jgi:arylsulfatase A-like enzyme
MHASPLPTILVALVIMSLATPVRAASAAPAATRPNLVFIYCDDLRWDGLGVVQREQGAGGRFPWIQTPRLDRLAAESVRFRESFVVTSLCSPGRAAVMTSRHGHLTGVVGNGQHLPANVVTFAQHLRAAGYTTAYFGKWHMRDQRERPYYDHYASFVGQGRYFDCPLLVNGVETPTKGWVDDVTTEYAARFVAAQPRDKPFFLWLGFKSPHGPRGGANLPERVKSLYADAVARPTPNTGRRAIYLAASERPATKDGAPGQAEAHRDYFRHVTAIDAAVGTLLDALERSGRLDHTLIIFTSDNGYYLGEHGLGDKRSAYDESLRVPLLIRLPGREAPRGRVHDAMTLNLDYAPTLLDYAGAAPLPAAQGRSLRPLLEGRTPADWRTAFFYAYFREGQYAVPTLLAVRTATHKLVTYPGRGDWTEVFDLAADRYETRNLAGDVALRTKLTSLFEQESAAAAFRWPAGFGPNGEFPPVAPKTKTKGGKKKAQP